MNKTVGSGSRCSFRTADTTHTPPLNAFTRARRLVELSCSSTVGEPQDRCDIANWFEKDYRLTLNAQFAIGFALAGVVGAFDAARPSLELSLLSADRLDALLEQLGLRGRKDAVLELISAPRAWYADRFSAADHTAMDVAWRRAPFEQRPFLQWGDGHLLLLSPRALISWLGEGFQHRAFACAARRGEAQKQSYMRYFGQLIEAYAQELTESVRGRQHDAPRSRRATLRQGSWQEDLRHCDRLHARPRSLRGGRREVQGSEPSARPFGRHRVGPQETDPRPHAQAWTDRSTRSFLATHRCPTSTWRAFSGSGL